MPQSFVSQLLRGISSANRTKVVLAFLMISLLYRRRRRNNTQQGKLQVVVERLSRNSLKTKPTAVTEKMVYTIPTKRNSEALQGKLKDERTPFQVFVDHPLTAWVLENGSIALASWIAVRIRVDIHKKGDMLYSIPRYFFRSVILLELMTAFQHILINHVYAHHPFFSAKRPQPGFVQVMWDWLQCNAVVSAGAAVVQGLLQLNVEPKVWTRARTKKFHIPSFLLKVLYVRVVGDVTFYIGHRILHENRFLYKYVHKRHHEHNRTALITNYHFSPVDLAIEGFTPIMVGLSSLFFLLGIQSSDVEMTAIGAFYNWYEIASHSGKEIPTATTFPPLAPLLNWLNIPLDDRNIEFHEKHHNSLKCNYGITTWVDKLCGTARYGLVN